MRRCLLTFPKSPLLPVATAAPRAASAALLASSAPPASVHRPPPSPAGQPLTSLASPRHTTCLPIATAAPPVASAPLASVRWPPSPSGGALRHSIEQMSCVPEKQWLSPSPFAGATARCFA
ncbi:hypothetical protein GUJ93_ZPchr0012g21155 [Zizania palustris]|uniref:Uncharacterized protein n=1 Tax=Zizania palustris TaxID=103762 RepID=A0A8J5WRS8_ZIZPA|nr:hypothetical protein GUJ93_ZPchr0012g21155 [Zizania palustris]KAG8095603.1 hypothetical protein GUJ93_ZPchr0012g21155 [Zizania palustris]